MQSTGIDLIFEGNNLLRILEGTLNTIQIAFISILLSLIFGVIFGIIYTSRNKIVRFFCRFYLEVFRIIPILVLLFVFYFVVPSLFDIDISGEFVAIYVFVLWGIAEIGDITRGAMESIPKHNSDVALALGFNKLQVYIYILIPLSFKRVIPGVINLTTRMIKTTSLVIMIGVVDVIKVGQQIIESNVLRVPDAAFWIYGFIFVIYFIICYPMSKFAKVLENRWNK
ncbi:amino acid ABC transporter permease [Aliarcobacter lanthieri]|uniref:amino acid ABC transporter permease n=1 Tax=Aliarcobacter lanthieri TaxID=1355374 RepID=UPI00047AFF88|nr:amino acid ABC transporter permease [Aliarcobacter lanthieri]MBL3520194.1 amino acid ABC transporter permease [Aliarcobacter lanthieri]QKF60309.1 amino acid ABC transporter, permease protein [Aliarcobacter lanthieri]